MIISIIGTTIGLLIYDFLKKIIKIFFIKKQKKNLNNILHNTIKKIPIDLDFWEEK